MRAAVEIVPFRLKHLREVLAIERASFAHDAYPARLFCDFYRRGFLFFVARLENRTIGYIVSSVERTAAEIISIAVAPAHRRCGVGSALMLHTLQALEDRGVSAVRLTVRAQEAGAIRFYESFGFEPAGRIPRYYEDGAEGLCMRLRLGKPTRKLP